MKRRYHGRRALLNGPGFSSTAAIVAEIEDTSTWPKGLSQDGKEITKYNAEPNYTFQIANCDRSVSFELDFDVPEGWANSLRKVDTMIDTLTKFREGLIAERAAYAVRTRGLDDA